MATTLDCALLRDLYGTPELCAIFSTGALIQSWLDVEAAIAAAEAEVGVVPPEAAARIARECDSSLYDFEALRRGLAATRHPLVPLIRALTEPDELERARARLAAVGLVAQLSGAAGTLATLGDAAEAAQAAFCRRLGLARAGVHWHATRDRLRDLGHALSQVAAAAERIASEVTRLEATEVGEAFEPSSDSHVGSSTMPQKRNPMICEYIVAGARLLRGSTGVLVDSPAHAGERDMSFWAVEWLALRQAMILCGGILDKLAAVLEGLHVDEARLRANLELTRSQIMAEAAMMALGASIGREKAHALVREACHRSSEAGTTLGADVAAVADRVERASSG